MRERFLMVEVFVHAPWSYTVPMCFPLLCWQEHNLTSPFCVCLLPPHLPGIMDPTQSWHVLTLYQWFQGTSTGSFLVFAIKYRAFLYLVGGLEHDFYEFPYIGNNHPNWLNWLICFRGAGLNHQAVIKKNPLKPDSNDCVRSLNSNKGALKMRDTWKVSLHEPRPIVGSSVPAFADVRAEKEPKSGPKRKTASIRGVHKWIPKMVGLWKILWIYIC